MLILITNINSDIIYKYLSKSYMFCTKSSYKYYLSFFGKRVKFHRQRRRD